MSHTTLVEKATAVFFNLSPILVLLVWKFGPTQFSFFPPFGMIIAILLVILYVRDIWKKRSNSRVFAFSLLVHLLSISIFLGYLFGNPSLYNLALLMNWLSFNIFTPVRNYEDMVNYVKTHQKTRGFETALILEDLPFKNDLLSPLDIAITKTMFLKFFTGDFYSSKQSAILSFNLSTVVMVYMFAFIPTGPSFMNLLILVTSYTAAFIIGLSFRSLLALSQYPEDLVLEAKSYIRIGDKPAIMKDLIRKGILISTGYGAFFILLAIGLQGETRPPLPTYGFEVIDWPSFLFFPLVLLMTYPIQKIWKSTVWSKLKIEKKTKKRKKGKRKKKL